MAKQPTGRESHVPLEILANQMYLTKRKCDDTMKVTEYMTMAEEQVSKLAVILGFASQSVQSILMAGPQFSVKSK